MFVASQYPSGPKTLFKLIIAALTVTSCARSDSPLTDQQQAQLKNTLQSSGRGYLATLYSGASLGTSSNLSTSAPIGAFSSENTSAQQLQSSSNLAQMSSLVTSPQCDVQLIPIPTQTSTPSGAPNPDLPPPIVFFDLTAANATCPVNMNFEIQLQQDPVQNFYVSALDYAYNVQDPSFATMNDVDQVSLSGGVNEQNMGTGSAYAAIQVTGQIHSQTIGNIPINIQGVLNSTDSSGTLGGKIQWQFQFPDFTANFEQDYDQGTVSNSLNSQSLSQSEFESYFQLGGDPFYYTSGLNRASTASN
ncbi:MAG: hypothetical protein P4M08_03985 [Oligoflexia bacterium]|nr:hypothetical protein [Oligoflexia bacterium]